jgi:flagellar biosynthesis protein FliR
VSELQALVFARCAGFVARAPGFSHPSVPPAVRAGLAFVLAVGAFPGIGSHAPRLGPGSFLVALATEVLLGAAIGMAASLLYDGAYFGGRMLDDYVGIRVSVPNAALTAPAGFGRVWSLAFLAAFFLLDGYRIVIAVFADAFAMLPPGALPERGALLAYAVTLPTVIGRAAALVAGPPIVLAFVAQCTLASVARVVPRLSTFMLSFPIVFGLALLATLAAAPLVVPIGGRPWIDLPLVRHG